MPTTSLGYSVTLRVQVVRHDRSVDASRRRSRWCPHRTRRGRVHFFRRRECAENRFRDVAATRSPKGSSMTDIHVTAVYIDQLPDEEVDRVRVQIGQAARAGGQVDKAPRLFADAALAGEFVGRLTLPGYQQVA